MKMKKYLSLLLALVLCMTALSGTLSIAFAEGTELPEGETEEETALLSGEDIGAPEGESEEGEEEEAEEDLYPDELRVGHPTITKGDFFTEMFGNDTADIDVRALIHGYNLVNWDQNQGVYLIDPSVVTDVQVMDDPLGNRTYYMALADDLYYSDGTPITAWDYAFSMLLMMAPEIEEIGGKIYRNEHLLGYRQYMSGEVEAMPGIQVLSDRQLAITLDHNFLPYFFETGLLLCVPYPIGVIAPGCKVYANDNGEVYIGNEDLSVTEPVFTAELLRKTILDPETGYNSHPSVVSGPYVLTAYDGTTCHFELNPYFKGAWYHNSLPGGDLGERFRTVTYQNLKGETVTYNLVIPTIEKIAFTVADYDTMVEDFAEGRLHLVNKMVYADTIKEMLGTNTNHTDYPRIGLSFLTFTFDWPTVHEKEVRQAIAWCMDRDQLTKDYCQDFGFRVDGYYGVEQWEYKIVTGKMEYPINFVNDEIHLTDDWKKFQNVYVKDEDEYKEAVAAWKLLTLETLTQYKVDTDKANALLDDAGWTLNLAGETYNPDTDEVRCKMVDGQLVALDLSMMYPEGNHFVDTLQENFIDNLNACGIKLTLVPTPMEDLLKSYYREAERTTDMIYLATNFHVIVDPSITYSTDPTANHLIWNNTYSDDEDLYWRAVNMRKTDPKDIYDYVARWVAFQERYNEVLPTIPVYSNIYYDFYVPELQNYNIVGHVTWTQAILEAYWGESAETTVEGTEGVIIDE